MSNTSTTTTQKVYNKPTKVGTNGNDNIKGSRGNEKIFGKSGDDWLLGRPGHDHLFGGTGNDILEGGIGRDRLNGGPGIDILTGGGGKDTFILAVNHDHRLEDEYDIITDFNSAKDRIVLINGDARYILSEPGQGFTEDVVVVRGSEEAAISEGLIVYDELLGDMFINENGVESGFGGSGGLFATIILPVSVGPASNQAPGSAESSVLLVSFPDDNLVPANSVFGDVGTHTGELVDLENISDNNVLLLQ